MYTSMLIIPTGLCCQNLHSGDYLTELYYHICTDTLGPSNLVNSKLRKLCPLDRRPNLASQTFNAYHVGEASKMEKCHYYIHSKGKKDDRIVTVRHKLSRVLSISTVKQHDLKPFERLLTRHNSVHHVAVEMHLSNKPSAHLDFNLGEQQKASRKPSII